MKYITLVLAFLLLQVSEAPAKSHKDKSVKLASAIVPMPKPIPAQKDWENWEQNRPVMIAQGATNPCPFPGAAGCPSQQSQPQTPVTNVPPGGTVNIVQPMEPKENFVQYLWMLVVSFVGTLIGVPQLKNAFGKGGDPRSAVDAAVLKILQDGHLQAPVQAGLSLVPGVGGLLAKLEPMIAQAIERALEAKLGAQSQPEPVVSGPAGLPQDFLKSIGDMIEKKIAEKLGAHS